MNITLKISKVNFKKSHSQEIQVFSEEELKQFGQGVIVVNKDRSNLLIISFWYFTMMCGIYNIHVKRKFRPVI